MRAIEFFLSHQSEDRDDVVDLEGALRRRGLASWRDRRSLDIGDSSDAEIRAAIEVETSGFVFYGSRRILGSDYVWEKEWPWAHDRHEREQRAGHPAPYRIAPLLLDGKSYRDVTAEAWRRHRPSPTLANAESLARGDPGSRDEVARRLLRAAVVDRVAQHHEPLRIRLTTFSGASTDDTDLLVDWSPEFGGSVVEWNSVTAAAVDLKNELARRRRPIEIDPQARLTAAFAFGHVFPPASGIEVTSIHRDGSRWTLGRGPDADAIEEATERLDAGDDSVAVVGVSFARTVGMAARQAEAELALNPGWRWTFASRGGPVDARVATAASWSFGRALRELRDRGVREAHVFMAAPAALALLFGSAVNAGPAMTLYYTDDGAYRAGLRIPA